MEYFMRLSHYVRDVYFYLYTSLYVHIDKYTYLFKQTHNVFTGTYIILAFAVVN